MMYNYVFKNKRLVCGKIKYHVHSILLQIYIYDALTTYNRSLLQLKQPKPSLGIWLKIQTNVLGLHHL